MFNFTHIGQCDWKGIRLIPEEKCREKSSSYRGNNLSIKDNKSKKEISRKIQKIIETVICRRRKIRIYIRYHTTQCIHDMPMISKFHILTPLST